MNLLSLLTHVGFQAPYKIFPNTKRLKVMWYPEVKGTLTTRKTLEPRLHIHTCTTILVRTLVGLMHHSFKVQHKPYSNVNLKTEISPIKQRFEMKRPPLPVSVRPITQPGPHKD